MAYGIEPKVCHREGCTKFYIPHKWGTMVASRAGWFMSRYNQNIFCPDHLPDWVVEWRAKKAEGKS